MTTLMTTLLSATPKFFIRVGRPWARNPSPTGGIEYGWSRTLERAMQRASKLRIRSDCMIYVTDGVSVLASSGIHSGPGGDPRTITQH